MLFFLMEDHGTYEVFLPQSNLNLTEPLEVGNSQLQGCGQILSVGTALQIFSTKDCKEKE